MDSQIPGLAGPSGRTDEVARVRSLSPNAAVKEAVTSCDGHLRTLIRMKRASSQLGLGEQEVILEFAADLLMAGARAVYQWEGRASLSTYTVTVFRNWLTRRLSALNHGPIPLDGMNDLPSRIPFVADPLLESLHACIDALPESDRHLVSSVYFGGQSVASMSRSGNLKAQQIYQKIYAALNSLYQCLAGKGFSRTDFLAPER